MHLNKHFLLFFIANTLLHFGCVRNTFLHTSQNLEISQSIQPNKYYSDSVSRNAAGAFIDNTATANLLTPPVAEKEYHKSDNIKALKTSLLVKTNTQRELAWTESNFKNKDNWKPDHLGAGTLLLTIATLSLVVSFITLWIAAALFLVSFYFLARSKSLLAFIPLLLFVGGILGYIFIHPLFLLLSLVLLSVAYFLFIKRRKKAEEESNLLKSEKEIAEEKLKKDLFVLRILGIITIIIFLAALAFIISGVIGMMEGASLALLGVIFGGIIAVPALIFLVVWFIKRKHYRRKKAAQL